MTDIDPFKDDFEIYERVLWCIPTNHEYKPKHITHDDDYLNIIRRDNQRDIVRNMGLGIPNKNIYKMRKIDTISVIPSFFYKNK